MEEYISFIVQNVSSKKFPKTKAELVDFCTDMYNQVEARKAEELVRKKYKVAELTFPENSWDEFAKRISAFAADGWRYVEVVHENYKNTEKLKAYEFKVLFERI